MIVGICGPNFVSFAHKKKIIERLEKLFRVQNIETAIISSNIGADTLIAEWIDQNTSVEIISIIPCCIMQTSTDRRNYGLERATILEMNAGECCKLPYNNPKYSLSLQRRDQKLVKLCDEVYCFSTETRSKKRCLSKIARLAAKEDKLAKTFQI